MRAVVQVPAPEPLPPPGTIGLELGLDVETVLMILPFDLCVGLGDLGVQVEQATANGLVIVVQHGDAFATRQIGDQTVEATQRSVTSDIRGRPPALGPLLIEIGNGLPLECEVIEETRSLRLLDAAFDEVHDVGSGAGLEAMRAQV